MIYMNDKKTKKYKSSEITEVRQFAVGRSHDGLVSLALYNEDKLGYESDTVVIELTQKRLKSLIKMLEYYVKVEE